MEIGYLVSIWLVPVLVAITFHEAAHGFVAWRLGDDTAKAGRDGTFRVAMSGSAPWAIRRRMAGTSVAYAALQKGVAPVVFTSN